MKVVKRSIFGLLLVVDRYTTYVGRKVVWRELFGCSSYRGERVAGARALAGVVIGNVG